MTFKKPEYHAVKISYKGQYRSYHIYRDNEVFMVPAPGQKIGRDTARNICKALNAVKWRKGQEVDAVPYISGTARIGVTRLG